MCKVSIIIPTYNEEKCIEEVLKITEALDPKPHEVIVVDGGSTDRTCEIIKSSSAKLIEYSRLGRAAQMHAGVVRAKGEIICFLHADTHPPKNLVSIVRRTLEDDEIALAGFRSIMKGTCHQRTTTFHNRVKTYYAPFIYNPYRTVFKGLRLLFGDQLMFCRRSDYMSAGGFDPEVMIMEEADLCLKMNRLGKVKQIKNKVYSSDRRVAKWGLIKANLIYISIASLWALGVPSSKLAKFYTHIR